MENPDTNENTTRHIVLRQPVKDGPVFVVGGWPECTTIRAPFIDGNLFARHGDVVTVSPSNGVAEYLVVTDAMPLEGDGNDVMALELQPGSVYEPEPTMIDPVDVLAQYEVPAPLPTDHADMAPLVETLPDDTRAADAAALAAPALGESGASIVIDTKPEPVADPVTAPVTEPVTASASTTIGDAVPGLVIPDDATLDAATDEGLVILIVKHLEGAAATSRDHAISLLKAARDEASKAVGEVVAEVEAVVAVIEGAAQDGSTKGSTWNMAHQLWVMPKAS